MKASPKGRVRPIILFSQTPHSVSRRAKLLPSRTAAELLRHLCQMTIGFGRGFVDITYKALAKALYRDWRTIARAARLLRDTGDVITEPLRDGSYRWYVPLELEDITSDPEGVYRVRAREGSERVCPHDRDAMPPMTETPCPHDRDAMPPMTEMTWGHTPVENSAKPFTAEVECSLPKGENEALKIYLKDTNTKIHQQISAEELLPDQSSTSSSDDELLGHKELLRKLDGIGVKTRMARKLLNKHEHTLIQQALTRATSRGDIGNPAGYLIRELEDGGYEELSDLRLSSTQQMGGHVKPSDAPLCHATADQTKAESERLEAEKTEKEAVYRQGVKRLLERYAGLSEDLKARLKGCWTRHLDRMLPNTPRKAAMLQEATFQRLAFKEVAESFFGYLDDGLAPENALGRLAA